MPELPDLLYIRKYLKKVVERKTITGVTVKQPVILRVAVNQPFEQAIINHTIMTVDIHGPFIRFELSDSVELIVNLMLAGKLQHQQPDEKPQGYLCCSLLLEDGARMNLCDDDKMAKLYVVPHRDYASIPKYKEQGVDILSPDFTRDVFRQLALQHSRKQVRVFINDHTALSSIGNAYADEILFDAKIHPKTFTRILDHDDLDRLYSSIRSMMEWGIREVEKAAQPIHVKVRDHMKVRNRRGEPCPRCGSTIRREGVRGHDVFFCPICQPASRKLFIDWANSGPRKP
ncbi:MAG TPA: DNA-formamidopyrimidine glycosylase [Bacteroidetes bacterium]|nr:DNA-formamidopyrimidine glycosylase [Bacteroidota bacterium]